MSFQLEKAVVRAHFQALAGATPDNVAQALAQHTTPDWHWRGMHPFYEQHGPQAVADSFWTPLLQAVKHVQRREDIFFAGTNTIDNHASTWVVSMGHFMGLHDEAFLGIPPTRKITMLRYAEFNQVVDGCITQTALFIDLLHFMRQAGINPLPLQTGMHLVQPGPATHDGLQFDDALPAAGADTLALINRMIGDINNPQTYATPRDELAQCWHDDMVWWGPDGIGATYTQERYIEQHQRPFRTQLADRKFNGHLAKLSEGNYGAFFGWPNLTLRPTGGYMGLPANGHSTADMRVVDVYRRDGNKLAENWIFIDMLHFLHMQGLDVLAAVVKHRPT
jgi:predicted ester cyclase